MIDKGKVISSALLGLGEVREYNNNNYELYKVASDLFDEMFMEFSYSPFMGSNLEYVKLTKYNDKTDYEGRFIYNKPMDCLGVIRAVRNEPFEEVGEKIHSYSGDLVVLLNKRVHLNELSDNYFNLLKLKLSKKIAEVYPQFSSKLGYILNEISLEENRISIIEAPKHLSYLEDDAFGRGY